MNSTKMKKYTLSWILKSGKLQNTKIEDFEPKLHNIEAVYTLPGKSNHLEKYTELIDYAVDNNLEIYLSNFMINYEPIVEKLIAVAENLKGKIFVITPFEMNNVEKYKRSGNWNENEFSIIQRLVLSGVRIRGHSDAHWKFIITGDRSIVSSSNMVEHGFEANPEFGFEFNFHITKFLKEWFQYIWKYKTNYERRGENTKKLEPQGDNDMKSISGKKVKLSVTYDYEKNKKEIINHLDSAKESIHLSTYLLSNSEIIDILTEKAKSEVEVKIILPQRYLRIPNLSDDISELEKHSEIKYCYENHSKIILIDKKTAIVGTGNLDNYLNEKNLDLTFIIKQEHFVKLTENFYKIIWDIGGTKDEITDLPQGNWEHHRKFKVLIDNPYRIHPKENNTISYYRKQLKKTKYIRHYKLSNTEFIILDKETTSTRKFKLNPIEEGYRLDKFKDNDWKLINDETPTYLERVDIEFFWYDINPGDLFAN